MQKQTDGPPSNTLKTVAPWSSWYMTESITIYLTSAKLILVIHLKMNLRPTCEVTYIL
jgi:hypothetical protein